MTAPRAVTIMTQTVQALVAVNAAAVQAGRPDALYRFKIHRIGFELGVLPSGYAARLYSLISPPSTCRRSIRPSSV
ncbi:hypothetical protein ACFOY2_54485 [Nonomuraea purpurea]|uniref:Uncharacterized protein n=1 Tax=Nonomuraea purpurea TaxID=1849276 RepID=A0ABV8GTD8_9ACTN